MPTKVNIAALLDLRARSTTRRRTPNGERMANFRWLTEKGAVWLYPASFVDGVGLTSRAAESEWQVPEIAHPVVFSFWIAHAARQDVWRSLKGVPTLMPVIHVTPFPERRAVKVVLGAVMDPKRASHAVEAALADMFQPRRINAWSEWAARQTRALPPAPGIAAPERSSPGG